MIGEALPRGRGPRVPVLAAGMAAALAWGAVPAVGHPVQERGEGEACARAAGGSPEAEPEAEAPVATDSADPRELLERARARYDRLESMTARFEQTVAVPLLDRENHGEGRWYQKGAGRFKMDFSDPPDDVIVADGEHLWLYYPSTHPGQVIRTAIDASPTGRGMADLQGRIFQEARRGYRIEDGGAGRVSDVDVRQLVLTPTGEADSPYREVRIWLGRSDLLVRKFRIVEENETVRTVRLWDLRPDAAVADSVFRFRVPEGVEVFSG